MLILLAFKGLLAGSEAAGHRPKGGKMAIDYKKSEVKRPYEAVIIMDPSASEEEQKNLFQKNKEIIESYEGEVFSVETWGKRTLANPINKVAMGNYFHAYFTAKPEVITELERTMKINEKVMRYVHTVLSEKTSLDKHSEDFKNVLKESRERQQEAEARIQKKRAARAARRS